MTILEYILCTLLLDDKSISLKKTVTGPGDWRPPVCVCSSPCHVFMSSWCSPSEKHSQSWLWVVDFYSSWLLSSSSLPPATCAPEAQAEIVKIQAFSSCLETSAPLSVLSLKLALSRHADSVFLSLKPASSFSFTLHLVWKLQQECARDSHRFRKIYLDFFLHLSKT